MASQMSSRFVIDKPGLFQPELCELGYNEGIPWHKVDYDTQFEGGSCSVCRGPMGRRNRSPGIIARRPKSDFSSLEGDPALRTLISMRVKEFVASIAVQPIDFIET